MKDDDPEKRIRELERELADATPSARGAPHMGGATQRGGSPYDLGLTPPRRKPTFSWYHGLIVLVMLVSIFVGLAAFVGAFTQGNGPRTAPSNGRTTASSSAPTTVPQGGELRVGGNSETKTVACNDGNLTLYGFSSRYFVTGHCASLKVGGYDNDVIVDNADTLESTGYSNTVTDRACNNCKLTMSSYGIAFNVSGHSASLTISSYDNKVTVDSVDTINVSGYNNAVTYHSGAPKIIDLGYSNTFQRG
jgi:Protein of unknown function (DUF3060)